MTNSPNPHYISQNANGSSMTQPVDTVDFPHSGLIKALNQMAAGNVVVKTGTDFDINQTGNNLVVAAGKILRNGKYHEVSTKTFADSSLTTTYDKGYHLLVVADGREGGETVNVLYMRPPTAANRVPEFKLGDTIVAMIEYSSGTSAGSRLIQYFTTNKESNSLSIAYANSNVYTQAMTVDADSDGDVTFENVVQDKDIIFKVNNGGSTKDVLTISGADQLVHIKTDHATNALLIESTEASGNGAPDIMFYKNRTPAGNNEDIGHLKWRGKTDNGTTSDYADIFVEKQVITNGSESGKLHIRTKKAGTMRSRIEFNATHTTFNAAAEDIDFIVEGDSDGNLIYANAGSDKVGIGLNDPKTKLTVEGAITLKEQASADADTAAYGQLWTKTATPNELYFTNDAGNDIQITSGSSLAGSAASLTYGRWEGSAEYDNLSEATFNTYPVDDSTNFTRSGGLTGFSGGTFTATASTAGTYIVTARLQFGDASVSSAAQTSGNKITLQLTIFKGSTMVEFARVQKNGHWVDDHFTVRGIVTLAESDQMTIQHKLVDHVGSSTQYRIKNGAGNPCNVVTMVKIA